MATDQMHRVIRHLHRVRPDDSGLSDGLLLEDYLRRGDQAAVAVLVRRHGRMVWGVCRRVLRNYQDAEDAFQATFLVLLRRAASIGSKELLANWLYGTARLTALKARALAAKRTEREVQMLEMPEPFSTQRDPWSGVQPTLDEELTRLPDQYRAVVVLCDLEGHTRKEAARHLGCPEGTVASRLTRARAMLAKRIRRRGVALSGGGVAAVLAQQTKSAVVPNSVVDSTIHSVSLLAAGKSAAAAIPVQVAALTEGVLKTMLLTKLKAAIAVMLAIGVVVTGTTILADHKVAGQEGKEPAASKPAEPAAKPGKDTEAEDVTAWGKEVGGLQAGLGYLPGQKRTYRHGETVKLSLRVRNIGRETVEFKHIWAFFVENPPTITDAGGKLVQLPRVTAEGLQMPRTTNVGPGKEVELYEWTIDLQPKGGVNKGLFTFHGTGRFSLQCERVVGPTSANPTHPNPALDKLATGKLKLEITSDAPPQKAKTTHNPPVATETLDGPSRPEKYRAEEGLTAWGNEVDGLQAGLGYKPGERRAYRHGETVTFVLKVRNVGKKEATFSHLHPFVEHAFVVTDGNGKPVPQPAVIPDIGERTPGEVKLRPGEVIEIHELKRNLRPAKWLGNDRVPSLYGAGKFGVRYDQVLGSPEIRSPGWTLDPALSKLATGTLELEVQSEPPAATGKEPAEKRVGEGTTAKPIKIRVYIEKVNIDTSTITASCMLIGEIDEVTKPLRLENLRVAEMARITNGSKDLTLADLKHLPRDTHYYLFLKAYEEELGFEVIGIETIRK